MRMTTKKPIAIITDSTCDVPKELIEYYGIQVIPHTLIWGQQAYRDRVDLQPEDFYQRLTSTNTLPTTAQSTAKNFSDAFMRAIENGAKEAVVILLGSHFSGAIQSAQQAAETTDLPVHIHDSRNVTMGLGWQVLAAARALEIGGGVAEIMEAARRVRDSVQLYVSMDTVKYIARGGRIGNASKMIGAMLNIKPVVYVDTKEGIVEPSGMAVTHKNAVNMMYDRFFGHLGGLQNMHVAVMHGNAVQEAAALVERIQNEFHPLEILTTITGPVLGINTGPLALALGGYCE